MRLHIATTSNLQYVAQAMKVDNAVVAAETQAAVETLVNNVNDVVKGRAYGIDEKGELIGQALKSSFKGKVVDLLVRKGLASTGNLGGRLAVSLVGQESFDLIKQHRSNGRESARSSVINAIAVMSKIKKDAVRGDFDVLRAVSDELDHLSPRTRMKDLVPGGRNRPGKLMEVNKKINDVIIPERLQQRQATIDDVNAGRASAAMRGEMNPASGNKGGKAPDGRPVVEQNKIHADELRYAARAIADPTLAKGTESLDERGTNAVFIPQVSGRKGAAVGRAEAILVEFNRACHSIRNEAPNEDVAEERIEDFREKYLASLKKEFHRMDEEDGARTRRDGAISTPGHEARPNKKGHSVAFAGESLQTYPPNEPHREASDVSFEQQAFPGVAPINLRESGSNEIEQKLNYIESLLDPEGIYKTEIAGGQFTKTQKQALAKSEDDTLNSHQLTKMAKELQAIAFGGEETKANKMRAALLAGHPSFAQSIDSIEMVLPILYKTRDGQPSEAKAAIHRLVSPVMRNVAEQAEAMATDRLQNPGTPENAAWYQSYVDAFRMDVADQPKTPSPNFKRGDPEEPVKMTTISSVKNEAEALPEAITEMENVVEIARDAIAVLDRLDAHFKITPDQA